MADRFGGEPDVAAPKTSTSKGDRFGGAPISVETSSSEEPSLKDYGKALAYGAVTGLAGGTGELEKFGAYTVPEFLGFEPEHGKSIPFGRETIFPTISEAQQVLGKVGWQKPSKDVSGTQTVGEILGGFGTSLPSLIKGTGKALIGTTTKEGEKIAQEAEQLGFKLSPSQVRADIPAPSKGATGFAVENQNLANKLVSKGTGQEAELVTSEFIGERLENLGKDFDKLYKGKSFVVDAQAENALNSILQREAELGPAGVSTVKQTAQTMLQKLKKSSSVDGEDLQRLRNALTERARSSSSRGDAHEIYELVDLIDESVAKNNSSLAAELKELRPKYRNSIILEDLYRNGGVKQGNVSLDRLGIMMRGKRDVVRRNPSDIDNLGKIGRELGLKARWESEGSAATEGLDLIRKALGTGTDLASSALGLRGQLARDAQRRFLTTEPKRIPGVQKATAAGVFPGQLQNQEE